MAEHVCPVWVGRLLASPLRRLFNNPKKILGQHVTDGMTALDIGCAMGFFSLALAEMVGVQGKVICIDLQERMIEDLEKRARKAGLSVKVKGVGPSYVTDIQRNDPEMWADIGPIMAFWGS